MERLFNTEDKKRLISNFISLSSLQLVNYVLPLITFPYLVRVLGVEKFGLIAFATATIGYFQILTDYGFNLSATREISINRENKEKVQEIFSSVMIIKFGLLILSFLLLSILVFSFDKFREDWKVYFLSFGMVVGQVLFPVWFFQGMEKMKYITFLNILAKSLFTIAIFIFVNQQSDYWKVPLLSSIGFILAGVLSLWIIYQDWNIRFKFVGFENILRELKEGWYIFISMIAINLYTTSNTFILGLFTNNTIVGYYSAAERIVKAIQGLWSPVSQVLYPYFANIFSTSQEKAKMRLKKVLNFVFFITLFLSIIGCLLAPYLTEMLLGKQFGNSVILVQILIFTIFAIGVNNILGIQGLVAFGYGRYFRNIVSVFGLLHIFYLIILIKALGCIGVAIAVVITEILIAVVEYIILLRRGLI
jgi:PST family polysaccharide transporter